MELGVRKFVSWSSAVLHYEGIGDNCDDIGITKRITAMIWLSLLQWAFGRTSSESSRETDKLVSYQLNTKEISICSKKENLRKENSY